MRTKKALLNTLTSFLLQIVTVICGFVLPRLVINSFGSEVNGAVSSIGQFLGYIALLEGGVGGVTRAAMYKPLAKKDTKELSAVAKACQKFFSKLAFLFAGYALILAFFFKTLSGTNLDWIFIFSLVVIISISTFFQYYFGITNSLILQSDQSNYIVSIIEVFTVIFNTILSVILINSGCGVHIVKLGSSLIYVIRPLLLNYIVKRKYNLDYSVEENKDAVKQKWSGLGHHIAYFLHNNADIVVITMFLGLKSVSVYNVYFMIVSGVRKIVNSLSGGSEAAFGDMIAKGEKEALDENFRIIETTTSIITTIFFTTTMVVLMDFIKLYTDGFTDANYMLPFFPFLLVISEYLNCIKRQYQLVITAAGHYKQTQNGAFIEAGLNIVLSVVLVNVYGLCGVIIATIVSIAYRLIDYVIYLKRHILERSILAFANRLLVTTINSLMIIGIFAMLPTFVINSYLLWAIKGAMVFTVSIIVTFGINHVFYGKYMKIMTSKVLNVINR